MARRRHSLTALVRLAAALVPLGALAQTATPVALTTPAPGPKKALKKGPATPEPTPNQQLEKVRKALEALTPEQREQFRENLVKWMNLPPDDKKILRDAQEIRKKHMADEMEAALTESGLNLEPQRRQMFLKRYAEERRKIEEGIRQEAEAKRAPRLEEMKQRLKTEFSGPVASPAN